MPTKPLSANLDGLTLHVRDVERSREFYGRIPGFKEAAHRPGQFALFQVGDGLLGVDLRQLRLIALNLGLEVVEGVRVSSARKECDQEAEDHGQGDGPEESMSHSLF